MGRSLRVFCGLVIVIAVVGDVLLYQAAVAFHRRAKEAQIFPHAMQYREANRSLPPKAATRVVLFGDSRIAQWTPLPSLPSVEFVNRGIPGETTAGMRLRFADDVLALAPDVVVLQLGINDLVGIGALPDRRDAIVAQCVANLRYFVDTLRERGVKVVLLTIIPAASPSLLRRPVWSDAIDEAVIAVNRPWLEQAASDGLRVVDTAALLQDADGRWKAHVNADELHLTADGYALLNAALRPLLAP